MQLPGSGGVELCADVSGPADGPPVLLFHGGGQTRHSWGGTLDVLGAAGYHAFSVDLRGHGDSTWAPDGDYSHDAHARDVAAAASSLASPPALVGASLGGVASLLAAGRDPTLARAVVLVDITPRLEAAGVARILGFMRRHEAGFDTLEQARVAVAEYLPDRPRPVTAEGLRKNLRRDAAGRLRWHWDPRVLEHSEGLDLDQHRALLSEAAGRITVPTLLVHGGRSDVVHPDAVVELGRLIPHLEHEALPAAGHMVAGDQNDPFGEVARAFLDRLARAS